MKTIIPIPSADETEEEKKEEQHNVQKSSRLKRTTQYVCVTAHRYRTKFVLSKRSKSTSD